MIPHEVLDLVDHGGVGKVDQKHFHRGIGNNIFCALSSTRQRVLYSIGWVLVLNPNANPHSVDLGRVMEIDDLVTHHLVVRDIEIDVVVCASTSGTPVDLPYFGKPFT